MDDTWNLDGILKFIIEESNGHIEFIVPVRRNVGLPEIKSDLYFEYAETLARDAVTLRFMPHRRLRPHEYKRFLKSIRN